MPGDQYDIESGGVGENIGVVARDKTGKVVGTYNTEFHPQESRRRGTTVVRGKVEVAPEHQRKGLGTQLVQGGMEELSKLGDVTHQVGFSREGEKLSDLFGRSGYQPSSDALGVLEKHYPPRGKGGNPSGK